MPLTVTEIKAAAPRDKTYRLADGAGMYLEVTPTGGKYWRLKYRIGRTEKRLALGVFPAVGLKEARKAREAAREQLADGIDPGAKRKAEKLTRATNLADNAFETVAREWHSKQSKTWSASHAQTVARRLELYLYPFVGNKAVSDITPPEFLAAVRRLEARDHIESAHRVLTICGQVMRYAVATGRAQSDPTRDLRGALPQPTAKHMAAPDVTTARGIARLGELLRMISDYDGTPAVRAALQFGPLVFVRPGELRTARWQDIDLEAGRWEFTASKTKRPHIVPLSSQAVVILRELHPVTGRGELVFPNPRHPKGDRPMSDNAILAAYRRLGIGKEELSGHGWRAIARTLLDEKLGYSVEIIEKQLAHSVRDVHGEAYNRTAHLNERSALMQAWADFVSRTRDNK